MYNSSKTLQPIAEVSSLLSAFKSRTVAPEFLPEDLISSDLMSNSVAERAVIAEKEPQAAADSIPRRHHAPPAPPPPRVPAPPLPVVPLYVAMYDYQADNISGGMQMLSFAVGEKFSLLEGSDSGWLRVVNRTTLDEGWAPEAYLQLS